MALAEKGNKVALGIAVISGVLALGMSFFYLRSAKQETAASAKPTEPGVEVVRALKDLPADKAIEALDIENVSVPAQTFASFARTAVKASDAYAVAGRRVNRAVPSGSILQYSDLIPVQDLKVHEGMVVSAINVTDQALLGGLLVPGDFVDVVVASPVVEPTKPAAAVGDFANPNRIMQSVMESIRPASGSTVQWKASRILNSVRVLAIGGRLSRSRQQMMLGDSAQRSGNTVLLELPPDDALRLFEKTTGGENRITLFLLPRAIEPGSGQN